MVAVGEVHLTAWSDHTGPHRRGALRRLRTDGDFAVKRRELGDRGVRPRRFQSGLAVS